jgi:replicative DNA helicase
MKNEEIERLINSLGKEIKETVDKSKQEEALARLQEIAKTYAGEDEIISSTALLEDIKSRPPEHLALSGIGGLDSLLGGFRYGQLVILSGITKHGKTSFAVYLTSLMEEEKPMWLPFEEPAADLLQKFIDMEEDPPFFYTPKNMSENTLLWMEKKIIESKAKFGSRMIFIDHLHFILKRQDGESQEQCIGRTVRTLKQLAVKWGVIIVLIAHLKKVELDKHPNLEDLKDSSAIAQEADTVMFLWRQTVKGSNREVQITDNVNLSVQANRKTGRTGNVKLRYKKGRFLEEQWQDDATVEQDFSGI